MNNVIKQRQARSTRREDVVDAAQVVKDKAQGVKAGCGEKARDDGGAYKILWWDTLTAVRKSTRIAEDTPFDWTERTTSTALGTCATR